MKKVVQLSFLVISLIFLGSCKNEKKVTFKDVANQKSAEKQEQKAEIKKTSSFNFSPTKPVDGKLKGVVELGASGFNSFIINVDKNDNYEVKSKEFGNSLFIEGMTNANEVNEKLKEYIQKIVEFGVKPKDIHFVVSSGAKMAEISKIVTQELKDIGYVVNEVTPEQEGIYALKSVLPNQFKDIAYVVDIGSGNTKISYYDGDKIVGKDTYGAKYFQKNVANDDVYKDVKSIASNIPKGKRSLCFIIGGVPYNMAKATRTDKGRFTMLNTDIKAYDEVVKKKGKKVESGLNIFKAIADETGCKRFVFDWDANFTIGFLLDVDKQKK